MTTLRSPGTVTPATGPRRSVGWSLVLMLVGGAGFVGVYVVAVLSTRGQGLDNTLRERAVVGEASYGAVESLLPNPYLLLSGALGLGVLALLWHVRTGLAVLVSVPLLVASTQVLKDVLPRPRLADPWVMANSLPSGHTGAALALALALLLVCPRRLLPLAALVGGALTVYMGTLVVVLDYHRPSDVLASVLLAVGAGGLGLLNRGDRAR